MHGEALQQPGDLQFRWVELVWAAVTVGRRLPEEVLQHGEHSYWELLYRASILFANLQQTSGDRLTKSSAYNGLDPSEKGAISYFLGMSFSKAVIHRLCGVASLMHLGVYWRELDVVFSSSRSRPDLVGRDAYERWFVVESKGRTGSFNEKALQRAKTQTKKVPSIGGEPPYLSIGVLVHFGGGSVLNVHLADPKPSPDGKDLPLKPEEFYRIYYEPFLRLGQAKRKEVREYGKHQYAVQSLGPLDLTIGIDMKLVEASGKDLMAAVRELPQQRRQQFEGIFIGDDGILVELGDRWTEENMRKEPIERWRSHNAAH